jgi:hypothetical protein
MDKEKRKKNPKAIQTVIGKLQQRPYPHRPSHDTTRTMKFFNSNAFKKGVALNRRRHRIQPSMARI